MVRSRDISLGKINPSIDRWKDIFSKIEGNDTKLLEYIDNLGAELTVESIEVLQESTYEVYLEKGEYLPKTNTLDVWVDNAPQSTGTSYVETSPTSIRFNEVLLPGQIIVLKYYRSTDKLARTISDYYNSVIDGGRF